MSIHGLALWQQLVESNFGSAEVAGAQDSYVPYIKMYQIN